MSNELPATVGWIYSRLDAPARTLNLLNTRGEPRIYDEVNSDTALYPFFIIILMSHGDDWVTINGGRIWTDPLYQVAAVHKTKTWEDLAPLANVIDSQLDRVTNSYTNDLRVVTCMRLRTHQQVTNDGSTQYRKLGSIFRLQVAAL